VKYGHDVRRKKIRNEGYAMEIRGLKKVLFKSTDKDRIQTENKDGDNDEIESGDDDGTKIDNCIQGIDGVNEKPVRIRTHGDECNLASVKETLQRHTSANL
jgi:hypothetical protein